MLGHPPMNHEEIKAALLASYEADGGINHLDGVNLPSQESVNILARDCMHLLFPGYFEEKPLAKNDVPQHIDALLLKVGRRLRTEVEKSLRLDKDPDPVGRAEIVVESTLGMLPSLRRIIQTDVAAAYRGDPAARNVEEIILAYPCVLVVSLQRLAHELYLRKVPLLPRMLTEYAHERTGCDIHPGAEIGPYFFVDHATGVVIGETARIGQEVKIYQGVTLGAKSFVMDEHGHPVKGVRRHPKLENGVIVYAGASIMGGDTVIGENSVIGSNVSLMESVPANSIAYRQADGALIVRPRQKKDAMIGQPGEGDWMI
jgi:serine O-acetyltransferase